jgi:hypothetical protein
VGLLPVACDRGRVSGCAKSRHASGNAANVDGWVRPNDAVTESENESESEVSANAGDARKEGRVYETTVDAEVPCQRTSLLRRSRSSGSQ